MWKFRRSPGRRNRVEKPVEGNIVSGMKLSPEAINDVSGVSSGSQLLKHVSDLIIRHGTKEAE
ncbi:uncharacterized protein ColSpa_10639 [Colletotrichum spaethianum]|uniref:Uncharacterized protein n=1 Tax=Colletotrichum spaethianum TaxID=700344 RepID=A0AA37PE00_9PEZI|nr:uncharacterized protein ColSpa_10639 [Colletotrichum spaethianum]GKT50458.1 hypothetical protein ColSpa_10639 [Colletotrichum spaethianum]